MMIDIMGVTVMQREEFIINIIGVSWVKSVIRVGWIKRVKIINLFSVG
jgi:hypothetical protein